MATATKKKKNTAGDGEGEEDKDNEAGLVDFNATDVKKVLKRAQKRGFITHDEINQLLPDSDMSSDQIEDVMSQISEMGIAVVETEEEAEEQE
jgi:RNA polymerase primary sigma factor